MSRKLIDKLQSRLAGETGTMRHLRGGRMTVALVYPNTYAQAMSNLGFQTVYHWFNNRSDCLCERFFLPDPEDLREYQRTGFPLVSLETQQPLADYDLVAFSISFENDYVNLPTLFELGRLPLWSRDRDRRHPLVLCGGVCAFLNPEPLADIMDLFAVGEAEVLLPELLAELQAQQNQSRGELLKSLAQVKGCYVPVQYRVTYKADGRIKSIMGKDQAPAQVRRQWLTELDTAPCHDVVLTDETEFGAMYLTEVSRGCTRGCRFCAAGYIYLPARERSLGNLQNEIVQGRKHRQKIGLVGAAVSDYSRIDELNEAILADGGKVSVASVRIDSLTKAEVRALQESGHKTLALAPEAGSQRMRDLINKGIDENQILQAVRMLGEGGIQNLKLYFMVGLPGEEAADIEALLTLVRKIRETWEIACRPLGRMGKISLSVNPFIPKPFTPLQWAGMARRKDLDSSFKRIRAAVTQMANVEVSFESLRNAELQAFLSRGDRRVGQVLPLLAAGKNLKTACREADLDPATYITRERDEAECFPWEVIDIGVARNYLWQEYQRGLAGRLTPPCQAGCTRCGICH